MRHGVEGGGERDEAGACKRVRLFVRLDVLDVWCDFLMWDLMGDFIPMQSRDASALAWLRCEPPYCSKRGVCVMYGENGVAAYGKNGG